MTGAEGAADRAEVRALEVGPATAREADAIRALPGLDAVTGRLLDGYLGSDRHRVFAARRGEGHAPAVVGASVASVGAGEAHVLDVVVHPRARGRGVGRALVTALVHHLAAEGVDAVTLEVRPSNGPALALYRRCGFVAEGRRPRYYPDGEDAVLMWRR